MALQLFMKELLADSASCYPEDISIVSDNARVTRDARPLFTMLDHKHKEDRDRWRRIANTRSESDSCLVVPTRRREFSPQFSNGDDSTMPRETESDEELSTLKQRRPGLNGKDNKKTKGGVIASILTAAYLVASSDEKGFSPHQSDKALVAPRRRISINSPAGIENFGSNEGSSFFQCQGSVRQSPGEHFLKETKMRIRHSRMGAQQFRKALPFELPFSDTSAYGQNRGLPKDDGTPIVLAEG